MDQKKLEQLLSLFVEGRITREDYDRLFDCIRENPHDGSLMDAIDHAFQKTSSYDLLSPGEKELIYQNIIDDKQFEPAARKELDLHPVRNLLIWKQLGE